MTNRRFRSTTHKHLSIQSGREENLYLRYIFYICINFVGCRVCIIYIQILYLHVRLLYIPCYDLWTVLNLLCEAYHSESTFRLYSYLIDFHDSFALLEEMLPWFEDVDRLITVICMSQWITLHPVNKELVILDVDLDSTVAEVV